MTTTDVKSIKWEPGQDYKDSRLRAFLDFCSVVDMTELHAKTSADPAWFWDSAIQFLDVQFYEPYTRVLDLSDGIQYPKWCLGAKTNLVLNCLDKHRGTPIWEKTYLVWEGEDGTKNRYTYAEFDAEVCRLAGAFRERGIGRGDIIATYIPMLPEAMIAFFAILKVGGVFLPLFSGFGPEPLRVRLSDSEARVVITADGGPRRGIASPMKSILDEVLADCPSVTDVFVVRRLGDAVECPMLEGRDHWWHEAIMGQPANAETERTNAEELGFLVYTSGTTGKPKGVLMSHVGAVTKLALDIGVSFDFGPDDRMVWISDMGWVVGALTAVSTSYFGGSLLVVEGTPDYPDTTRHWRVMQENDVTFLGIAPTTVRGMMRYGDEVDSFDFSKLRIIASTGEPWTDAAWLWLFEHVSGKRVPIMNYTGGTECFGGIASSNLLGPITPASFNGPMPGSGAEILNEAGMPTAPGELGELVMTLPAIGNTRSLWRDDDRYMESYWSMFGDKWRQGDWAMRDDYGYWYVLGRSDDTLNISGKRTGPAEIEGALMSTGRISEAAVIGVPDEIKGTALCCVCVPMPGVNDQNALQLELSVAVTNALGRSYRPRDILFVSDLPKTRNMKIMRRVVRAVVTGEPAGDLSSLVNPEAVEELKNIIA
ncbi:MAG: AMP-binding protein [Pseudomonadota bacterium]|nr:AMP-binding protein [Pseudomonadota bacterium]